VKRTVSSFTSTSWLARLCQKKPIWILSVWWSWGRWHFPICSSWWVLPVCLWSDNCCREISDLNFSVTPWT